MFWLQVSTVGLVAELTLLLSHASEETMVSLLGSYKDRTGQSLSSWDKLSVGYCPKPTGFSYLTSLWVASPFGTNLMPYQIGHHIKKSTKFSHIGRCLQLLYGTNPGCIPAWSITKFDLVNWKITLVNIQGSTGLQGQPSAFDHVLGLTKCQHIIHHACYPL